ncbi:MAG: sialate O-acetylesterase [Planctomycetota bacterium]
MLTLTRRMLRPVACSVLVAALPVRGALAGQAGGGPVKVFILAGQSNMEGQGVVDLDHPKYYNGGRGILNTVMKDPAKAHLFRHLKDAAGEWVVRDDVRVDFKTRHEHKKGGLTIGFTGYGGKHHIGPELQFGHVIGDYIDEPVFLIKTAWGGKSLYKDFRPPQLRRRRRPLLHADARRGPRRARADQGALPGQ